MVNNIHADKNIKFQAYSEKYAKGFLHRLLDSFASKEPMGQKLGLTTSVWEGFIEAFANRETSKNHSVLAIDEDQDKVVGACLNEVFGEEPPKLSNEVEKAFSPVLAILDQLDKAHFQQSSYSPSQYLHIFMIAADPLYSGQGIASGLIDASHNLAITKGLKRSIAETTGPTSTHVFCEKSGYHSENKILYDSFIWKGHTPFAGIKNAVACHLVTKNLDTI